MSFQRVLIAALLAGLVAQPASAAGKSTPKAMAEAAAGVDYSSACHPGEAKGLVLCETRDSFAYCKSLEGKGKMLIEGDEPGKATVVMRCEQTG